MRSVVTCLAALACCFLPAAVHAHEIAVLPVGSAQLDAGTGSLDRLVHATLDAPGDELVVTLRGGGHLVQLLVPDQQPERGLPRDAKPRLSIEPARAAAAGADAAPVGDVIEDEVTAEAYEVLDARLVVAKDGEVTRIRVRRGAAPARVALWVGAPSGSFAAGNVDRTPRALVKLRAWSVTPAPSSGYEAPAPKTRSRSFVAWYGAGIALLGVLIGTWWVWSGRRRSRERGAERAAAERRDG